VPPKAPDADPPDTEAVAAPTGTILPTGDVLVRLVAPDGSEHRPGAVPAGRYDIFATFPGRVEGKAGQVEVAVGQVVKLTCNATFHRCTPR
jgi:hypothetical protein